MDEMTEHERVIAWFVGSDTGLSSETLAAAMVGVVPDWPRTPGDVNDLGRCMRLMALFPEWTQERLATTMSPLSHHWRCLAEMWPALTEAYAREAGKERCPDTYALMRQAERRGIEEDPDIVIHGRNPDGHPSFWSRNRHATMRTGA